MAKKTGKFEGFFFGNENRRTASDRRYVLALLTPSNMQPRQFDGLLQANCRALTFDTVEEATQALTIVLKRRQFGEAQDIMRSTGYDVQYAITLGVAVGPNDVIGASDYPVVTDPGSTSYWQRRQAQRTESTSKKGPTVFYGCKSQLQRSPAGEDAPFIDYARAVELQETLYHMAEVSMIG